LTEQWWCTVYRLSATTARGENYVSIARDIISLIVFMQKLEQLLDIALVQACGTYSGVSVDVML
jgi:hypothetical protein